MRYILLFFLNITLFTVAISQSSLPSGIQKGVQKRVIDTSVLGKWSHLSTPRFSGTGEYFAYATTNPSANVDTLIVLKVNGEWSQKKIGKSPIGFSCSSDFFLYSAKDTLFFLNLLNQTEKYLPGVLNFSVSSFDSLNWIAYQLQGGGELILRNIENDKTMHFQDVKSYSFENNGKILLLQTETIKENNSTSEFKWIDLTQQKEKVIWSTNDKKNDGYVDSYIVDEKGEQLAFVIKNESDRGPHNIVCYFNVNMERAKKILQAPLYVADSTLYIKNGPSFTKNGKYLFLNVLKNDEKPKETDNHAFVTVWRYNDEIIQPEQQMHDINGQQSSILSICIDNMKVSMVADFNESLMIDPGVISGDYTVVRSGSERKDLWYPTSQKYILVNLANGERKIIVQKTGNILSYFDMSPRGGHILYWDSEIGGYFCYNIADNKLSDVTQLIRDDVMEVREKNYLLRIPIDGIVGWISEDELIIYGKYDIYKINCVQNTRPENITLGYGLRNSIKLRFFYSGVKLLNNLDSGTLYLTGFNVNTKHNGFYGMKLAKKQNPELLFMGPYTFYKLISQMPSSHSFSRGMEPFRAKSAKLWIVQRQSAIEAPNYYLTSDFKTFKQLTDNRPQKDYNWLTAELIKWKTFDGTYSHGVLYKPQNFDPKVKYPMIINYYEKLTHRIFEFPYPEYFNDDINVPFFVSRGYIVFTPDIHYTIAAESQKTFGDHAYNTVASAAKYLSQYPYIDGTKIGIQGHSFGGQQTGNILTRTGIFAAAAETSGTTDNISSYLSLGTISGNNSIEYANKFDHPQSRMGKPLWSMSKLYLAQSVVLNADKIKTPLLIIHGMKDGSISYRQGIELYLALRRLQKKVWMIVYDEGQHVFWGKEAIDYTIRLTQFFDYYLKSCPPPIWMTKGIPFKERGFKTGYDLDSSKIVP